MLDGYIYIWLESMAVKRIRCCWSVLQMLAIQRTLHLSYWGGSSGPTHSPTASAVWALADCPLSLWLWGGGGGCCQPQPIGLQGWWLFPPVAGFWENVLPFFLRLHFFSLFFEWSLRALIPFFRGQDQSTRLGELRRLWLSVTRCVACELCLLIGSHTVPGQRHSQPTPTS